MKSYSIFSLIFVMSAVIALNACDDDHSNSEKTPIDFKPSLSNDGISWKDGDQLLITYSTKAESELTACYKYEDARNQWNAVEKNVIYTEDIKSISQVEGFGQSSNPPISNIYTDQSILVNYLSTRHLLGTNPEISIY